MRQIMMRSLDGLPFRAPCLSEPPSARELAFPFFRDLFESLGLSRHATLSSFSEARQGAELLVPQYRTQVPGSAPARNAYSCTLFFNMYCRSSSSS